MTRRRTVLAVAAALAAAGGGFAWWWGARPGPDTNYNRMTVAIMERVMAPDDNGIDVGAYIGALTRPMARIAPRGRHWAVEPQPIYAERLRKALPTVQVCQCALGDSSGTATFILALDSPARSSFRRVPYPTPDERTDSITVTVRRLDDLVPPGTRIKFIKIDVEGAEYLVLRGAAETIRRDHPVVVFEYGTAGLESFGTTPEMLWSLLHDDHGYDLAYLPGWLGGDPPLTKELFVRPASISNEWMFIAYPR